MADKKNTHKEFAEKILAKLPKAIRDESELKAGGGDYTILKVRGKSVASVRNNNVRIVHPTDSSADSAKALAALIAEAAPEKKAEPKPKADSKSKAKDDDAAAKKAEKEAEAERAAEAKIEAEREAEAASKDDEGSKGGDAK
jgi:hypothetical protein